EVPVRPPHDDRVARGDLPLDLRSDQPEPCRCEASGDRQPAVANGEGRGQAERGAAQAVEPDPRAHAGSPQVHEPADGARGSEDVLGRHVACWTARTRKASTRLVTPRMIAIAATHATSKTALRP